MKPKFLIPLAASTFIIGFLIWFFSDTQVIKRRTTSLLESINLEEGTGRIERAGKSKSISNILDSQLSITYPQKTNLFRAPTDLSEPTSISKDRATTAHSYLMESVDYMKTENSSFEIKSIEDDTAHVETSFTLIAKQKNGIEKSANLSGSFTFKKINNKWLLSTAKFSE